MKTFLRLKHRQSRRLPPEFKGQDVRFSEELVATFLQRFTRAGDQVFDPFAGFGTTLIVAEAMGRVPFGVEYDQRRVAYVRSQLARPERVIQGDSRRLANYEVPLFDFSITSPPFIEHGDAEDPLTNYTAASRGYDAYLDDLRLVYGQLRERMAPQALAVLEVANLKGPRGLTPLAWDIARAVSRELRFEGEFVIGWDAPLYGYDHSYCLLFRR